MSKLGRKFQEAMKDPELQARLQAAAEAREALEGGAAGQEEEEATVLTLASDGACRGVSSASAGAPSALRDAGTPGPAAQLRACLACLSSAQGPNPCPPAPPRPPACPAAAQATRRVCARC